MGDETKLKNVTEFGNPLVSEQLKSNIVSFFQYGFLGVGAFYNVRIPSSGTYGGHFHRLRLVNDPYYTRGQVWEAARQDWVWETGVAYSAQPIRVSGVFTENVFRPATGVGPYSHTVNYPLGRVVFNTAINPTSVVTCEYSYRHVQFSTSDVPWFRSLMRDSMRVDDFQFLQEGSGGWSVLAQNRVQLPHVVVQVVPRTRDYGRELGSRSRVHQHDVLFHVLAETDWEMNQISDVIGDQWDKRIWLYNLKKMYDAPHVFPLDGNGSPSPSGKMYPELVAENGYRWQQLRFTNVKGEDQLVAPPLYYATARVTVELDLP